MGRTQKEKLTDASGSPAWGRGVHISTEFAFLLSGVFIMLVAWALNVLGTIAGDRNEAPRKKALYRRPDGPRAGVAKLGQRRRT